VGLLTVHKINFASTATFPGGDLTTLHVPWVGNFDLKKSNPHPCPGGGIGGIIFIGA